MTWRYKRMRASTAPPLAKPASGAAQKLMILCSWVMPAKSAKTRSFADKLDSQARLVSAIAAFLRGKLGPRDIWKLATAQLLLRRVEFPRTFGPAQRCPDTRPWKISFG